MKNKIISLFPKDADDCPDKAFVVKSRKQYQQVPEIPKELVELIEKQLGKYAQHKLIAIVFAVIFGVLALALAAALFFMKSNEKKPNAEII